MLLDFQSFVCLILWSLFSVGEPGVKLKVGPNAPDPPQGLLPRAGTRRFLPPHGLRKLFVCEQEGVRGVSPEGTRTYVAVGQFPVVQFSELVKLYLLISYLGFLPFSTWS